MKLCLSKCALIHSVQLLIVITYILTQLIPTHLFHLWCISTYSGSSTSATIASVNAPSNQLHHLSYDNDAYAGLDISTACHPPSLFEESDFNPIIHGWKRPSAAPKLNGLIQSSTTSILLASTPPMLPRWSLTDPSGRPLLADCQRPNPSKALKSRKSNSHQKTDN